MNIDVRELSRRRTLRIKGASDGRVYIGPQSVLLHITDRCNLRCRYCWYHSPGDPRNTRKPKDFPFDKFLEIVRDARGLNIDSMVISGEGEPTMHPQFTDMMRVLARQPFKTVILSNGTFAPALRRDVLKASAVRINLGAADREGYKKLQGRDMFARVTENIRELAALRDAEKPGFEIEVIFVVNKFNAGLQKKMFALVKRLGADVFTPKVMSVSRRTLDVLPERDCCRKKPEAAVPGWSPCFKGWFETTIELDGRVGVCCWIDEMDIANVSRRTLRDIWASDELMRVRLAGRRGDLYRRFEECAGCPDQENNINIARTILACKQDRGCRV